MAPAIRGAQATSACSGSRAPHRPRPHYEGGGGFVVSVAGFVGGRGYARRVSELASHQKPGRRPVALADLTLIVRPPQRPAEIRAYTDAERADAELYAAETGAAVEPLA